MEIVINELFDVYYKKDVDEIHRRRISEEWFYALFFAYIECDMQQDFITMTQSVVHFYLNEQCKYLYSKSVNGKTDKTMDEAYLQFPKISKIDCINNSSMARLLNLQCRQRYICTTFSILSQSNLSFGNQEFTTVHKFLILIFIGKELNFRKQIMEKFESHFFKDKEEKQKIKEKIENLFKFCIMNRDVITNEPMNYERGLNICKNYVKEAIKVYEGLTCIYYPNLDWTKED